jgi:hypothetical protein
MARWYSPLMSMKNARTVALLRPGAHDTIVPLWWSATQVR